MSENITHPTSEEIEELTDIFREGLTELTRSVHPARRQKERVKIIKEKHGLKNKDLADYMGISGNTQISRKLRKGGFDDDQLEMLAKGVGDPQIVPFISGESDIPTGHGLDMIASYRVHIFAEAVFLSLADQYYIWGLYGYDEYRRIDSVIQLLYNEPEAVYIMDCNQPRRICKLSVKKFVDLLQSIYDLNFNTLFDSVAMTLKQLEAAPADEAEALQDLVEKDHPTFSED